MRAHCANLTAPCSSRLRTAHCSLVPTLCHLQPTAHCPLLPVYTPCPFLLLLFPTTAPSSLPSELYHTRSPAQSISHCCHPKSTTKASCPPSTINYKHFLSTIHNPQPRLPVHRLQSITKASCPPSTVYYQGFLSATDNPLPSLYPLSLSLHNPASATVSTCCILCDPLSFSQCPPLTVHHALPLACCLPQWRGSHHPLSSSHISPTPPSPSTYHPLFTTYSTHRL